MNRFNKAEADAVIDQLAHALDVLKQGRSFGICVIATPECIEALKDSDHPDCDAVIAHISPSVRIPEVL